MKKIWVFLIGMMLFSGLVVAHGEETFSKAEEIIDQKIPCEELNSSQLEILGDYYMEQMHPGEEHEYMDEMMGGEGSESLEQMHINMGKSFYCGEHESLSRNSIDTMMGRGMIGYPSMMGNSYYESNSSGSNLIFWIVTVLAIAALVLLIIWLSNGMKFKRGGKK